MISPQLPRHSLELIEGHGLGFDILYDQNLSLSDTFGLTFTLSEALAALYLSFGIDLPEANGTDDWRLPMPARYVMNEEGLILHAEVNPDYTRRPEPAEILKLL